MLTKIKKQRAVCNDCGFIGVIHISQQEHFIEDFIMNRIDLIELPPVGRETPLNFAFNEPFVVRCKRKQVSWVVNSLAKPEKGLGNRESISRGLKEERPCSYFMKYQPGYSPSEHLKLQEEKTRKMFTIKIYLISAIISAIISGIVTLIINVYT